MDVSEQPELDPTALEMQAEFDRQREEYISDGMDEERAFLESLAGSIARREDELARIKREYLGRTARLQKQLEHFRTDSHLVLGAREAVRRLRRGKAKSYRTGQAMLIGERGVSDSISWHPNDEAKLMEWAEKNCPDALTTTTPEPSTSLTKAPLLQYAAKNDRLPPGTTIRRAHEELYIRRAKESSNDPKAESSAE